MQVRVNSNPGQGTTGWCTISAMTKRYLLFIALLGCAALAGGARGATPAVNVSRLVPTQPSGAGAEQVGVIVFFDFSAASHTLLKRIDQWAVNAGSEVVIDREPYVTQLDMPLARAFMTSRTLGITNPVLDGLFNIPANAADPQATRKQLQSLFKTWGIGAVEFNAAWHAQVTHNGFIRAQSLAQRYGVKQAPAIVVDGIWRLTPGGANDIGALMQALNDKVASAALIASENQ